MSTRKLQSIYTRLYKHFGPQDWWPGDSTLEIIVGAVLTQNTNWQNVEKAIAALKKVKVLSVKGLTRTPVRRLARLIRPAGYFNVKARRLKNFLRYLNTQYKGSLKKMGAAPAARLREELLSVNGIGPETADSILLYAFGKPVFVIDAYTKRIFSRCGLVAPDIAYHDLQDFFMKRLPPDTAQYNEYHALIVNLGKDFCKPTPKCPACPLVSSCKFPSDSLR